MPTSTSSIFPKGFEAYAVCTGTPQARDLNIPGRDLNGVHFALDLLSQQNRVLAGQTFSADERVTAKRQASAGNRRRRHRQRLHRHEHPSRRRGCDAD